MRVCNEVLEIGIRLLLKIVCVVLGFGTATIIHGNSADLAGSVLFLIGTFGAFAVLRPLAYRVYPALKQSDLRRRNPPCNSFSTCRNMELVLRWLFGNGLQEASVAPAGIFLRPKSPALLASRATRRATALEKWLSPGSPRAYLQQLLSRQKLLLL